LRRYNKPAYKFTKYRHHAETWNEGKYGFVVIG